MRLIPVKAVQRRFAKVEELRTNNLYLLTNLNKNAYEKVFYPN